jgi:hypothetical protein
MFHRFFRAYFVPISKIPEQVVQYALSFPPGTMCFPYLSLLVSLPLLLVAITFLLFLRFYTFIFLFFLSFLKYPPCILFSNSNNCHNCQSISLSRPVCLFCLHHRLACAPAWRGAARLASAVAASLGSSGCSGDAPRAVATVRCVTWFVFNLT